MATSAILSPTPYDFSRKFSAATAPANDAPSAMSQPQKSKPKLSLNTTTAAAARTFGRGTTALRLDTLSACSPTLRNTYKNAWEPSGHHGESETLVHPVVSRRRVPMTLSLATASIMAPSPTGSASSARNTPAASRDASPKRPLQIPYTLPSNIRSILTNGPHAKRGRPPPTPVVSDSPSAERFACPSPTSKKVCFRDPVSEDIWTTEYTARHSDLRSRSTSPALPLGSGLKMTPIAPLSSAKHPAPRLREVAAPRDQRRDEDDEDDGESVPKTPVAGRNKKERDWAWTNPSVHIVAAAPASDSDSEEDLAASLGESVAAAAGFWSREARTGR